MMLKKTLILSISLFVTACGPTLEQVVDYIPPITGNGLACLQTAQSNRLQCYNSNDQRLRACHDNARQESKSVIADLEQQYTVDLENYIDLNNDFERARKGYNEQQRLILRDGDLAYIECSKDVNMTQIAQFPHCKPFLDRARKKADDLIAPNAPIRPERPNQDNVYRELSKYCSNNLVNCDAAYDQAYISCGGRIERSTICVANCN